ncbi:MAG: MATE family efflux transporter [Calditrichaeota bacterium]|nr:MAG: MATE family efflux transporter [Calditrichota bacterium]
MKFVLQLGVKFAILIPFAKLSSSIRTKMNKSKFDKSIIEGPILAAVWKLAWPTMLQNMIAGLQGVVDHTMVGHYVGFEGNAAIGVSWQIFLVVVVFISSLYSGMAVLVARFAGADDEKNVNHTVYQGILISAILAMGIMAPLGYVFTPELLNIVKAAPEVQAEALTYLRIMFVFSFGKLLFFMLGGTLRSAGDAKTPLRLGVVLTVLNLILNAILIPGFGPIPRFGTTGAAIGTVVATNLVGFFGIYLLFSKRLVVKFYLKMRWAPDWAVISQLFKFGLPTGFQGIVVNISGVLLLRFIGSLPQGAEAQAAFTVCYTQLFSLITWTSVGLMGATAAVAGQNLGAEKPERTVNAVKKASYVALVLAVFVGSLFLTVPEKLLLIFGMKEQVLIEIAIDLLQYLSISGIFIALALVYTGGLQGTGDTRSPLFISIISQAAIPLGYCILMEKMGVLEAHDIWIAILLGHITRCVLSFLRFSQGHWREIKVVASRL